MKPIPDNLPNLPDPDLVVLGWSGEFKVPEIYDDKTWLIYPSIDGDKWSYGDWSFDEEIGYFAAHKNSSIIRLNAPKETPREITMQDIIRAGEGEPTAHEVLVACNSYVRSIVPAKEQGDGGIKQGWKEAEEFIQEYIDGYEMRADEGEYTPNEDERALIADAIHGLIGDMSFANYFTVVPKPPTKGRVNE